MKYLAILKDSLREALDSKVLYVLLGLSLLITLFVATLSFRPLPAQQTMTLLVNGTMNDFMQANRSERRGKGKDNLPDLAGSPYRLENVKVLGGTPDSPDADYGLTISKMYVNEDSAEKVRQAPEAEIAAVRKHFARLEQYGFYRVGAVAVAEKPATKPFNVDYVVELRSTPGTRRIWLHETSLFFGAVPLGIANIFRMADIEGLPLGFELFIIAQLIFSTGSWIAVLLGVIITSFFLPNMLQKGTVDLLLVKPIGRTPLLLFKFLGGLTFIFLINAFAIVGIWLALGVRSGIWAHWTLLLIPILTFFFAILYSVSALLAVLTRSTVTAILVTIGVWFLLFGVGATHQHLEGKAREEERFKVPEDKRVFSENVFRSVVDAIHRLLPRTSDLNELTALLVFSDFMTGGYLAPEDVLNGERNWWESFGVSTAFIAVMLGLASWRFSRKDY